jgi:hypothetical protein
MALDFASLEQTVAIAKSFDKHQRTRNLFDTLFPMAPALRIPDDLASRLCVDLPFRMQFRLTCCTKGRAGSAACS